MARSLSHRAQSVFDIYWTKVASCSGSALGIVRSRALVSLNTKEPYAPDRQFNVGMQYVLPLGAEPSATPA
jgi:hypothetical protein